MPSHMLCLQGEPERIYTRPSAADRAAHAAAGPPIVAHPEVAEDDVDYHVVEEITSFTFEMVSGCTPPLSLSRTRPLCHTNNAHYHSLD